MAILSETRERIRFIVTDALGPVLIDRDGDLLFPTPRGRVAITVRPFAETHFVEVSCIVGERLTPTPALLQHVARNADGFVIGHLGILPPGDGAVVTVVFTHRVFADGLDPAQFLRVVRMVACTGEEIAAEMSGTFGHGTAEDDDAIA